MCEYVNENWEEKTALHLSAYVMWRLNWIHPFSDGNGRTARILSYLVFCARLKTRLPGQNTIPEQISQNKNPYYEALEMADKHYKQGAVNLSELEKLLEGYLANQLVTVHDDAVGIKEKTEVNKHYTANSFGIIGTIESHPVIFGFIGAAIIAILIIIFS